MKQFREIYECDSITLNVTNNCNLSCPYCFEHAKNEQMMSAQTAIDIIDASYREVDKSIGDFTINLFGGEPMLNWAAIKALIDHCNEKKYKVRYGVTTNLTILTDEMIDYIDDNSIMLLVSIDGVRYVHNKNRCDSFDIVYSNLKRLIARKLTLFVEARMTILPEDALFALDGIKLLIELGVDNICPMPVTDVEWSDMHISELEEYYADLMEYYVGLLNNDTLKRNISIKNTDEILTNVLEPEIDDPIMCPIFSNKWCAFDTNGDIYPCHQGPTSEKKFKDELYLGNLYTGVDETKLKIGDTHASYSKEECKDCVGKSICKGGCPTQNMRESGVYDEPSDGHCKTNIALVKAVLKYRDKLMDASNIRNRMVNLLKENLKLKQYVDVLYNETDLNNDLVLGTRVAHLMEMVSNLGEKNLLPTFKVYIDSKIKVILAFQLSKRGVTLDDMVKKLKEEENNG